MARTLLDMAKNLERRAAGVSSVGNEAKKRKVLAAVRYLAYATPVDTSRALSNWQVGVGEPVMTVRQAFFPGIAGSSQQASAENTINFAEALLRDAKPGQPIYITNLLPYIKRLNEGWSNQNPGGFVEAAQLIVRTTK